MATGALLTLAVIATAVVGWLAAQHRMSVVPFLAGLEIVVIAIAALLNSFITRRLDAMHADLVHHMHKIVKAERKHSEQMILAVLRADRQQQVDELADCVRNADIRAIHPHDRGL